MVRLGILWISVGSTIGGSYLIFLADQEENKGLYFTFLFFKIGIIKKIIESFIH